jgi:LysR family cyn operon transcriptional activator
MIHAQNVIRGGWVEMDLRHLRAFVGVADAGGIGRAVARLHRSQPALSRQIRALEAELDVRLFDRVGRRVQLTAEGEDLLRYASGLLADVDAIQERARALGGGQTGIVRLGATPQAIETLLAVFLAHHRRRHPGVEVQLLEDGGARLPARLERGDVHIALVPGDSRFQWRLLFPVHVLAVSSDGTLKRRATLEVTELTDVPLLLPRREFGSRQWFDAACQDAHLRPRVLLESGAPHTLVALAEAGYGLAIIPSNARVPRTGVHAVPLVLRGVPIGRWVGVAWDPRRFLAPYAERLVEELLVYARRAQPGRDLVRRAPPLPQPRP